MDNDETASVICDLVHARYLVIFTSADGIYRDPHDPSTLVDAVEGKDVYEVLDAMTELQKSCIGASRAGANGARAKLDFIRRPVMNGTTVMIARAGNRISDVIEGKCKRTVFRVR